MSDLINPITDEWDEQLLRDNFLSIDVEHILQIPIFHHETEDFVAWHLTKTGTFSVRSAYYRQLEDSYIDHNVNPSWISASVNHPVWRKLWSLKLPSKVKIFLWRCLHNAVPCRCVLANRHIVNSSQCPVCRIQSEDVAHALLKCGRDTEIWTALGLHEMIGRRLIQRGEEVQFWLQHYPLSALRGSQM